MSRILNKLIHSDYLTVELYRDVSAPGLPEPHVWFRQTWECGRAFTVIGQPRNGDQSEGFGACPGSPYQQTI